MKDDYSCLEGAPVSMWVVSIDKQLDIARAILRKAEGRRLLPHEQFAVARLTKALEQLTHDVRRLLDE